VNANGVIFGKNSVVNAGGLLASGLDIHRELMA
jgi:filamentous hemagglutinin family protein